MAVPVLLVQVGGGGLRMLLLYRSGTVLMVGVVRLVRLLILCLTGVVQEVQQSGTHTMALL